MYYRICWINVKDVKDNAGEYKKAKAINKNIVAEISHEEHEDVFLNKICMRHKINRIQNRNHKA